MVIAHARSALDRAVPPSEALAAYLAGIGESIPKQGVKLFELLKRPGVTYTALSALYDTLPALTDEVREETEILAHYDGYIEKQREQVARQKRMEDILLPETLDYTAIEGLRLEARQKLQKQRPLNLGQASRISGVSPADVSVLMVQLKRMGY